MNRASSYMHIHHTLFSKSESTVHNVLHTVNLWTPKEKEGNSWRMTRNNTGYKPLLLKNSH